MDKKEFLIFASIFLLISFLYFFKLDKLPPAIHGDEAWIAIQSLEIIKNPTHLIGVGWYDLPLLSFVPHALGMWIFDKNILGNRLGSVFFGLATLPIFYLLLKTFLNKRTAMITTIIFATSNLWLALSRLGIMYVQAAFFLTISIYFLVLGVKYNKRIFFILTGISIGMGMYSYYAIRALPLIIFPLVLFIYFIKEVLEIEY